MFTGIVEEIGSIRQVKKNQAGQQLLIQCNKVISDTKVGDSIACNGVCLTVVEVLQNGFWADVMNETAGVTNVGTLKMGSKVNLERAMAANGRFSGHIVSGHIDCQEEILEVIDDGFASIIRITKSQTIHNNIVLRGSVTVNGVSLTVMENEKSFFAVSLIPHTKEESNLKFLKKLDKVNIEVDIFGKYIQAFLEQPVVENKKESAITEKFLRENGF